MDWNLFDWVSYLDRGWIAWGKDVEGSAIASKKKRAKQLAARDVLEQVQDLGG